MSHKKQRKKNASPRSPGTLSQKQRPTENQYSFSYDHVFMMHNMRPLLAKDIKVVDPEEKFDQHIKFNLEEDFDPERNYRMRPERLPSARQRHHVQKMVKDLKELANDKDDDEKKSKFPLVMLTVIVLLVALMIGLKLGEEDFVIKDRYEEIDYYKIMNITDESMSAQQIKKHYRKMVIKWHPDRNPGCGDECVKIMGAINDAYIILSNPETRAFHDKYKVKPPESMVNLAKAKQGGRARK